MDADAVRKLLQKRVDESTQRAVADDLELSEQYVCDVLKGRREPGRKMLRALGIRRIVSYARQL